VARANLFFPLAGDGIAFGTEGEDHLLGYGGNDIIAGSVSNNIIDGGSRSMMDLGTTLCLVVKRMMSLFFALGSGANTIVDFSDNPSFLNDDDIDLADCKLSGFGNLNIFEGSSGSTLINLKNDDEITVLGVAPGALGASDFLF